VKRSRNRLLFVVAALAVIAAACGSADAGGAPTTSTSVVAINAAPGSDSDDPRAPAPPTSRGTANPTTANSVTLGQVEAALNQVRTGASSLALGTITATDGDLVSFGTDELLVDNVPVGATNDLELDLEGVEVGDRVIFIVSTGADGSPFVDSVGVWDKTFSRARGRTNVLDARTVLGDLLALDHLWDAPDASGACGLPVEDRDFADPVDVFTSYVAGTTPRQSFEAAQVVYPAHWVVEGVLNLADGSGDGSRVDPVSRRVAPLDENHVFYQLAEGVEAQDIQHRSMVPIVFDVSGLEGATLVGLLDTQAERMLGQFTLGPDDDSGVPGLLVVFSSPPEIGNSVTIVTSREGALKGCVDPRQMYDRLVDPAVGTRFGTVGYDGFAGTKRLRLDVASGEIAAAGVEAFDEAFAGRD
jgi:hypothetical protein